jgi:hypothetical protein
MSVESAPGAATRSPAMAIALVIAGRIADVDQLRVFRANLPLLWGMLGFCF